MSTPISARIAALRDTMAKHGVAACIVPTADPHLSEYLPAHWKAREWFSGFDGSAGILVVTAKQAGLWTDSRYFSQAEQQLAGTGIALMKQRPGQANEHLTWLQHHLHKDDVVAIAGDSVAVSAQRQIERQLAAAGASVRVDLDVPGLAWPDRPTLPHAPVYEHPLDYAGTSRAEKFDKLRNAMRKQHATHHLVSSLDDIAWLTNLRGSDVECNPVFLAHLLVEASGRATLFVDRDKLKDDVVAALDADSIRIANYATLGDSLGELKAGDTLLFDPAHVVSDVLKAVAAEVKRIEGPNPSTAFKAIKTENELAHIREVMRRDGAALARAFRRLEERLIAGMTQTELDVDTLLRDERSAQPEFVGESFATIAGYMENGALPHYRATPQAHNTLQRHGLLLVDSGGQYLGGTTDITRVLALGPTTAEQRRDATLVMKGMIALSRARFPKGASGPQLDALARAPLWAAGMDYGHGTGHGVGYFLNVHEGPHSVRPPVSGGMLVALEPGMITSIEPGLYKPARHGIRHENLAVVVEADQTEFGEFYAFETLTLCPFDRRALEPSLLSPDERAWLEKHCAPL